MANSLPLLYLDSSVPSAYYNDHDRERQIVTQQVWHQKLPNYHLIISNITLKELGATKNRKRRKKLVALVDRLDKRMLTPTCIALAYEYLKDLKIPKNDAFHIAIATINYCEVLLSWNFTHLVNDSNKKRINDINLNKGYKTITIISPNQL
ncbi:PIN domain-containing protein [candidate division KSB1 bacterium]|nr:PIN domain-containing protein [candidate division KSB1 bacterium]